MKKWLLGVMMLIFCALSASKVAYADVAIGPNLSQGPVGLLRGLVILAMIIVIVIITWKIIQNIKKRK